MVDNEAWVFSFCLTALLPKKFGGGLRIEGGGGGLNKLLVAVSVGRAPELPPWDVDIRGVEALGAIFLEATDSVGRALESSPWDVDIKGVEAVSATLVEATLESEPLLLAGTGNGA